MHVDYLSQSLKMAKTRKRCREYVCPILEFLTRESHYIYLRQRFSQVCISQDLCEPKFEGEKRARSRTTKHGR